VIGTLLRALALAGAYLLVLTSLDPWDVALAGVLGLGVAFALRTPEHLRLRSRLGGAAGILARTAAEIVRGTWRTAAFCLGRPAHPGLVEVPLADRTRAEVAMWGLLTGESPDEIVVEVDEQRRTAVVHLLGASDPDGVRARHAHTHARWRGDGGPD
jgi:multisubunit Na+/H+ antiporter MnhE subunit